MKKHQINRIYSSTLILCCFIGMFAQLQLVSAEITETECSMSFTMTSNNYDLVGSLLGANTYTNLEYPEFDDAIVEHEQTRVSVSNVQNASTVNLDSEAFEFYQNDTFEKAIPEFLVDAPFDTQISNNLTLQNNNTEFIDSGESCSDSLELSGSITDLNYDDTTNMSFRVLDSEQMSISGFSAVYSYSYYYSGPSIVYSVSYHDGYRLYHIAGTNPGYPGNPYQYANHIIYYANGAPAYCSEVFIDLDSVSNASELEITYWNASISYHNLNEGHNYIPVSTIGDDRSGINYITLKDYYNGAPREILAIQTIQFLNDENNAEFELNSDYDEFLNDTVELRYKYLSNSTTNIPLTIDSNIITLVPSATFTEGTYVFEASNPSNLDLILDLGNTIAGRGIVFEYLYAVLCYNPIETLLVNVSYDVEGITTEEQLTCVLNIATANIDEITLFYVFDTTLLSNYDYEHDITFTAQNLLYNYTILNDQIYPATSQLTYVSADWIVPSETTFAVNSDEFDDLSYNSGFVVLLDYPATFAFTALDTLLFNMSFISYFTCTFDLNVISRTYLSKLLELTSADGINITSISFPYNNILHSYVNNEDYGSNSIIYPYSMLQSSATLFIEVILSDNVYLALNSVNLNENLTADFNFLSYTNTITLSNVESDSFSFDIPENFNSYRANIITSNLEYTEPYSAVSSLNYSEFYESQNYDEPTTTFSNSSEYLDENRFVILNNTESINYSENSTVYTQTGHFKGTYTFRDVPNDGELINYGWTESTASLIGVGVSSLVGHNAVAKVARNGADGNTYRTITGNPTSGIQTIEWYMMWDNIASLSAGRGGFYLYSGTKFIAVDHEAGSNFAELVVNDGSDTKVQVAEAALTNDAWYKFKMTLNYATHNVTIYKNDTQWLTSTTKDFSGWGAFTKVALMTGWGYLGIIWADSISFDWIDDYDVGDLEDFEVDNTISSIKINEFTDLPDDVLIKNFTVNYSLLTNSSTECQFSIYNDAESALELISEDISDSDSLVYDRDARLYFAENNTISFKIYLNNVTVPSNVLLNLTFSIYYYNASHLFITPNLAVQSKSCVRIGETNTFSITVSKTLYEIENIYFWNNLTFENVSLGTTEGSYTKSIVNSTSQYYSVEIYVIDIFFNWRKCRIDDLFIAKNQTYLTSNIYSRYYQNQTANITAFLYSNEIIENDTDITINYENSTEFLSFTNSDTFNFSRNESGVYTVNCSFSGNEQFLGCSIETQFELYPITFFDYDSDDLLITANTESIINNSLELDITSGNISFTSNYGSIYDVSIIFLMNYTETITETFDFEMIFNATADISTMTISNFTIDGNFTFDALYYQNLATTNFTEIDDTIILTAIINSSLVNLDKITIFTSDSATQHLEQLTNRVFTTDTSVEFQEYLRANRTFRYWYFGSEYSVNDYDITHIRTDTIESCSEIDGDYYFEQNSVANDLFLVDWDFNPEFNVSYEIISQSSLTGTIAISVSSAMYIENVTVILTLPIRYVNFANATQSVSRVVRFDIPYSSTSIQTFTLIGWNNTFESDYTQYSNSTSIRIEYTANAFANLTNVADSIILSEYYDDWSCNNLSISQDYLTNAVQFTIPFVNSTIVYYEFVGIIADVQETFEIVFENGTYCEIEYTALCELPQIDFALEIDLNPYDILHENWSANESVSGLSQNVYSKKLTGLISFTGQISILFIGNSSVPNCTFSRFITNTGLEIAENLNATYYGYLNYSKYSTNWIVPLEENWTLDGIHYDNITCDIFESGYFECPGWGTSIISSYLRFETCPIRSIQITDLGDQIVITINTSLPLLNGYMTVEIDRENQYNIESDYEIMQVISSRVLVSGIDLIQGENIIILEIDEINLRDNLMYLIPILLIAGGIFVYYYNKQRKKREIKLPNATKTGKSVSSKLEKLSPKKLKKEIER